MERRGRQHLILLHGFTGSPSSWDALGTAGGAIRPALFGHLRDWRTRLPSLHGFLGERDRLREFLDREAPPTERVLVGYSLGARMALHLALADPLAYRALVLIGGQPGLDTEAKRAARRAEDDQWIALLQREGLSGFLSAWESQPLFRRTQARLPPGCLRAQAIIRASHDAAGLAASLKTLGLGAMPPVWDALPTLPMRVTWVVGGEDAKFLAVAESAHARCRRSQLVVDPGVGHNVLLEDPEALRAVIEEAVR